MHREFISLSTVSNNLSPEYVTTKMDKFILKSHHISDETSYKFELGKKEVLAPKPPLLPINLRDPT